MTELHEDDRALVVEKILEEYKKIEEVINNKNVDLEEYQELHYVDLREYVGVINVKELKRCYMAQRSLLKKIYASDNHILMDLVEKTNRIIVDPKKQEFYDYFVFSTEFDLKTNELLKKIKNGDNGARKDLIKHYEEGKKFYTDKPYSKIKEGLRDIINPAIIKIMESTYDFRVDVQDCYDRREEPVIYAVNHTNSHDVPVVCKAIQNHVYIIAGDEVRNDINGLMFNLNGVDWVNRADPDSRFFAKEQAIRHILNGYNYLLFPEGTWNRTDNLIMLPFNWGVIEMAQKTGAPIVPVVTEYKEGSCFVKIGEPIHVTIFDDKLESVNRLRDIMATMKFKNWEEFPISRRCEVSKEQFLANGPEKYLKEYPKLNPDFEDSIIYWPYTRPCVAYEHLDNIHINKDNCWLYNPRYFGNGRTGMETFESREDELIDLVREESSQKLTRKL